MKKKWLMIGGGAVILAIFVVLALRSSGEQGIKVTVELARKGEITSIVTATGKVRAQADVDISADVMGRIEELPIKEGDRAKNGQLLVKIDDRSRRMDVAQSRGSLQSAISSRNKARIDLDREKQLFQKGLSSQAQLDLAQSVYDQSAAQVQIYQASLDRALDQLEKCTIRSPMDGIVTKLNSEKGENVVIGTMNNPGTIIMTISDLSAIEIEAEIDETDIASVFVGQDVAITLDAFPDTLFKGDVVQVGNSAEVSVMGGSDQVANFLVKILIVDKIPNIKPGMTASVDITTDHQADIIKVPAGAVVMRPEGTGEEHADNDSTDNDNKNEIIPDKDKKEIDGIFIVDQGKSKFVPVSTGIRDQQFVEISTGLSESDSVITGPYRQLRTIKHGSKITPEKPKFGPDADNKSTTSND